MNSVLIIGKPNSGKSLLFNQLTGLKQKVSNFPGVTVEVKTGSDGTIAYTDYPGIYSLNPLTKDEEVSVANFEKALQSPNISAVICTLDVTRLERSLALGLQIQRLAVKKEKPVIFALNMIDELQRRQIPISAEKLEKELRAPVIAISAKKGDGLSSLRNKVQEVLKSPKLFLSPKELSQRSDSELLGTAQKIQKQFAASPDLLLKNQNRLDRFFLSSSFGLLSFLVIMTFLFQSIFTWATPFMDATEEIVATLGMWTTGFLSDGVLKDFLNDAIFGGFGSFLVFVPQIFILTFIIGLLEDSGYLARASILCHRPLHFFGLSGKSFVPLLSGHACSIPAIMAARTIDSPKRRLLTIIAIPLMACSARLPVYGLLVAALIPDKTFLGGLWGLQGFAFFALYFLGIFIAMLISGFLSRTVCKAQSDAPFVIELPPYRLPSWKPLLQRSLGDSWSFVSKAGSIIFTVTVTVWVLGYFPNGELSTSWLSYIGRWIEPLFSPLGLDWKFGVAILASFLAREVFVGTLGTLFGLEGAEENISSLIEQLQSSGFSMASGFALLVFYAIALQCVSTLAVLKKETGQKALPIYIFLGYSALAYVLSLVTYQVLS